MLVASIIVLHLYKAFNLPHLASDVELAPYPSVTYRTIGGDLEFQIFLGPTPTQVVQQYVQVNL